MQIIFPSKDTKLPEIAGCIGFFDGVHHGHRFLIEELKAEAGRRALPAAVITFRNHPRKLIDPGFKPDLINTFDEKMEYLRQTGIDYCIVLDFTPEMRELTARDFIHKVLSDLLHIRLLLIGYDHRFGKNRSEGFSDYCRYGKEAGMEVLKKNDYSPQGQHISSSTIRHALLHGDPKLATRLLGHDYILEGKVVTGSQIGRTIGYPTANVRPDDPEKIIPKKGVYAAWVETEGKRYPGILNIGKRPTVENSGNVSIEVHLIDFCGNLYGKTLRILFTDYLREEKKMSSLEELKNQLDRDKKSGLQLLYPENANLLHPENI